MAASPRYVKTQSVKHSTFNKLASAVKHEIYVVYVYIMMSSKKKKEYICKQLVVYGKAWRMKSAHERCMHMLENKQVRGKSLKAMVWLRRSWPAVLEYRSKESH